VALAAQWTSPSARRLCRTMLKCCGVESSVSFQSAHRTRIAR